MVSSIGRPSGKGVLEPGAKIDHRRSSGSGSFHQGEGTRGTVSGWVFEITWGPAQGDEGFIPDPDGATVDVAVLVSSELGRRWREIDDFEGPGYERTVVEVTLDDGSTCAAQIYVVLTDT